MKKSNLMRRLDLNQQENKYKRKTVITRKNMSKKVMTNYLEGVRAIIDKHDRQNDKLVVFSKNEIVKEVKVVIFDEQQMSILNQFL